MIEKEFTRRPGHDLISWHALGIAGAGIEFDGNDLFRGVHMALDAIQAEGPEGLTPDDVFEMVSDLTNIAEELLNIRNKIRVAKGLKEIRPDQAATTFPGRNP